MSDPERAMRLDIATRLATLAEQILKNEVTIIEYNLGQRNEDESSTEVVVQKRPIL